MKGVSNISTWAFVAGGLIALGIWPSLASSGELQNLLDKSQAFAALPAAKHTPAFRLEPIQPAEHAKGTEWFYVCDDNERIGLIQTWTAEDQGAKRPNRLDPLGRRIPAGAQRSVPGRSDLCGRPRRGLVRRRAAGGNLRQQRLAAPGCQPTERIRKNLGWLDLVA